MLKKLILSISLLASVSSVLANDEKAVIAKSEVLMQSGQCMASYNLALPLAQKGNKDAQLIVAKALFNAKTFYARYSPISDECTPTEESRAAGYVWLKKAAESNSLDAMAILGRWMLVKNGKSGFEHNPEKGLQLIERARAGGLHEAYQILGDIYSSEESYDIPIDMDRAIRNYKKYELLTGKNLYKQLIRREVESREGNTSCLKLGLPFSDDPLIGLGDGSKVKIVGKIQKRSPGYMNITARIQFIELHNGSRMDSTNSVTITSIEKERFTVGDLHTDVRWGSCRTDS